MCPKIELWERQGDQVRIVYEGDWPVLPAVGDELHVQLVPGHLEVWKAVNIRHMVQADGRYQATRVQVRQVAGDRSGGDGS